MKVYVNEIGKNCSVEYINTLSGYVPTYEEKKGEHSPICYFNEDCCKLEENYLDKGTKCNSCPRIYPTSFWHNAEDDTCPNCNRRRAGM